MEYDYAGTMNKPIISIVLPGFYLNNIDDSKISRYFKRDNPKYISFYTIVSLKYVIIKNINTLNIKWNST